MQTDKDCPASVHRADPRSSWKLIARSMQKNHPSIPSVPMVEDPPLLSYHAAHRRTVMNEELQALVSIPGRALDPSILLAASPTEVRCNDY